MLLVEIDIQIYFNHGCHRQPSCCQRCSLFIQHSVALLSAMRRAQRCNNSLGVGVVHFVAFFSLSDRENTFGTPATWRETHRCERRGGEISSRAAERLRGIPNSKLQHAVLRSTVVSICCGKNSEVKKKAKMRTPFRIMVT